MKLKTEKLRLDAFRAEIRHLICISEDLLFVQELKN